MPPPTIAKSTYQNILTCYSGLGKKIVISRDLHLNECPYWRNDVLSPIFLSPTGYSVKNLKKLDLYFKAHPTKTPYDAKDYFRILTPGKRGVTNAMLRELEAAGWVPTAIEGSLNYWARPLELKIPAGVHVRFGKYFDRALYPDFLKCMQANFNAGDAFMKYLDKMLKTINDHTSTVMLYNSKGETMGAGLAVTKSSGTFLFCGSINKAFRGRGLWRTLVAARQMVSASAGAKFWVTSTRVPELMWRGEENFRITIFKKDEEAPL